MRKIVSIADTIRYWQYCDRLVGYYEENGIHINREPFGPLTGTLVPPSISNAISIIEALLAATQGVKNITVGYGMVDASFKMSPLFAPFKAKPKNISISLDLTM
jgi:glutamate mutase epsilon subunit